MELHLRRRERGGKVFNVSLWVVPKSLNPTVTMVTPIIFILPSQ